MFERLIRLTDKIPTASESFFMSENQATQHTLRFAERQERHVGFNETDDQKMVVSAPNIIHSGFACGIFHQVENVPCELESLSHLSVVRLNNFHDPVQCRDKSAQTFCVISKLIRFESGPDHEGFQFSQKPSEQFFAYFLLPLQIRAEYWTWTNVFRLITA